MPIVQHSQHDWNWFHGDGVIEYVVGYEYETITISINMTMSVKKS